MNASSITVTEVEFERYEPEIRDILAEYLTWLEGIVREAVGPGYETSFDAVLERDVETFRDPTEPTALFLARSQDREVGVVYFREVSETTAVIKRLYVRPAFRRRGIGRALVAELVETAADRGYTTLRLTTGPQMEAARQLYADVGFETVEPFEVAVPEEFHELCIFMRRSLTDDPE